MKKVVLLGDSIRLNGYGKKAAEMLKDAYEVWQPDDNCRFAQYTLRGLFDWRAQLTGADIVHWNNGLWDECDLFGDGSFTPVDDYVNMMLRIVDVLRSYHVKRIIFATTTPVRKANPHNSTERIAALNSALVPKLIERGVEINDLFSLLTGDIDANIREDDNIHLTEQGIDICAEAVCKAIRG